MSRQRGQGIGSWTRLRGRQDSYHRWRSNQPRNRAIRSGPRWTWLCQQAPIQIWATQGCRLTSPRRATSHRSNDVRESRDRHRDQYQPTLGSWSRWAWSMSTHHTHRGRQGLMIEWYRHTCHSPNISAGIFLYQCHRRDLSVIQTKAAQYHLREPGDVAMDAFYS